MLSTLISLGVIDGATSLKTPYVAGHAARVQGKIYIACGLIESRTLLGQTGLPSTRGVRPGAQSCCKHVLLLLILECCPPLLDPTLYFTDGVLISRFCPSSVEQEQDRCSPKPFLLALPTADIAGCAHSASGRQEQDRLPTGRKFCLKYFGCLCADLLNKCFVLGQKGTRTNSAV